MKLHEESITKLSNDEFEWIVFRVLTVVEASPGAPMLNDVVLRHKQKENAKYQWVNKSSHLAHEKSQKLLFFVKIEIACTHARYVKE